MSAREVVLPRSKSICNRLMVMEALAGRRLPRFAGECEDIADIRRCLEKGIAEGDCFIKESGTALRLLTAFFSIRRPWGSSAILRCSGRLAQRPLEELIDALVASGMPQPSVRVDENGEKSIEIVSSALQGGEISVATDTTTQYASALLLIAPYMKKGLRLRLKGSNIDSPYISMTVKLMRECGAEVKVHDEGVIEVESGEYSIFPQPAEVEADWSSAAFFYEYVALNGGKVFMPGLYADSHTMLQGDREVMRLFADNLGVATEIADEGVVIENVGGKSDSLEADMSATPDLVIPLAVSCCFKGVRFAFHGVGALRHKESDRIASLTLALGRMGYVVEERKINGVSALVWEGALSADHSAGGSVEDAGDHRIAMAIEAAGRGFRAAHPECVKKSFPEFYSEIKKLKSI